METASHEAKPERERYERIVAGATEIVQTLISLADGGPTPLDLVVEKVTALLDDSVALAPHSPQALRLRVQLAAVKLATAPTHGPGHQLATSISRLPRRKPSRGREQQCKAALQSSGSHRGPPRPLAAPCDHRRTQADQQ